MRKRISEQNIFPNFDLYTEYDKINFLISRKKTIGDFDYMGRRRTPEFTLEGYVNDLCFNDWNLRGSFLTVYEMRESMNIASDNITQEYICKEQVLDFIQYAYNLVFRVAATIDNNRFAYIEDKNIIKVLIDNLSYLTKKLDCTISMDDKTNEVFVLYDNHIALSVKKHIPKLEESINEYLQIDNRGDLKSKREILCTLYKELEKMESIFKGTNYYNLYKDTRFLFNNFNVRHCIEKGTIPNDIISAMSEHDLESWYDKTFDMFLSCIVITSYLKNRTDIDNIKKNNGDEKNET